MEQSEYEEALKKIEYDFEVAKRKLYIEYGLSKAKFKVGDIIKDRSCILLIDKIRVGILNRLPEPIYLGPELKKDLTPRKDGNRASIYGNDAELIKENITPSPYTHQ